MLPCMNAPAAPRIVLVDIARTAALAGMALFHFTYDLELFGHLPPGTTAMPGPWAYFARLVAGSFLFLAGVSLLLGHGETIRWPAFLRRLALLAGAAVIISLATYLALPHAWIFFGILHAIAAFSVIGLAFLRAPALLTAAVAVAVFLAPPYLRGPAFDTPALLWLGLSSRPPLSIDFEPLFPWLAPLLMGMAVARLAETAGLWRRLRAAPQPRWAKAVAWPGRHSLILYLIHQPVLVGAIWAATQLTR
jgi:uncharacterized membrane protein